MVAPFRPVGKGLVPFRSGHAAGDKPPPYRQQSFRVKRRIRDQIRNGFLVAALLGMTVSAAGCASGSAPGATTAPATPQGPVRLTAAVQSDPAVLSDTIRQLGQGLAGVDQLELLVNSGTAGIDDQGELRPLLSEAVPTTENGLWVVFPDGRMETTWHIREGAQWHDGDSFTSADLVFTAMLGQDKQLAVFGDPIYAQIEDVRPVDSRTLTVAWRRPYIKADHLFVARPNLPLPKHLLEQPYLDDKMSIPSLSYWHEDYIGVGPFKVREFVRSSHVSLVANDHYAVGRPQVDEIDVQFIPSSTTLEANLLAGAVDVVLGRSLSLDQALVVRDQWRAGHVETGDFAQVMLLYTQFINPTPAIIGDVQCRRALLYAMDRQELADNLQAGLAPIAHSFVNPGDPEFHEVQESIVRYEYDPRLAADMLGTLGYQRSADGAWRDSTGQPLTLEIRTTQGDDLQEKVMLAAADQWQRLGIHTDPVLVTAEQAGGLEYRATFPSFDLKRQPGDMTLVERMHSSKTPVPSNNFVGNNYSRYVNPEFDGLIDRYLVAIPRAERAQVAAQIIHHSTENLNFLTLFFQASPFFASDRIAPLLDGERARSWNSYQWEVR